jgi:DNA repair protein RadC
MNEVAAHDRPREKLERSGVGGLGDNELLAILIGHGTGRSSALASANGVLAVADGVHGLPRLRRAHLERVAGIGPAQASRIIAAIELGRRTLTTPARERPRFRTPAETAAYLLPRYGAYPVERFGVMLLDIRYRLMGVHLLSVGSIDSSLAHPRELLREALLASAPAAVAFHNHPSGDPEPSVDDIAVTRRLRMAGQVVGVTVIDHIILADARYCSMRERGLV